MEPTESNKLYDYTLDYYGNYVNDVLGTNNVITIDTYGDLFATDNNNEYIIPDTVLTGYKNDLGFVFSATLPDKIKKQIYSEAEYEENKDKEITVPIKLIRVLFDSEYDNIDRPAGLYQYICIGIDADGDLYRKSKYFILADADLPVFPEGYKSPSTVGQIAANAVIGGKTSFELMKQIFGKDTVEPPKISATITYNKTDNPVYINTQTYQIGNKFTIDNIKLSGIKYEVGKYNNIQDNEITDIAITPETPNLSFKVNNGNAQQVSFDSSDYTYTDDTEVVISKLGTCCSFTLSSTNKYTDPMDNREKTITLSGGYNISGAQYPIYRYIGNSIDSYNFNTGTIGDLTTKLSENTKFNLGTFKVTTVAPVYILISKLFGVSSNSKLQLSEGGIQWSDMEYVKTLVRTYTSGITENYEVFKSVNNFNTGTFNNWYVQVTSK